MSQWRVVKAERGRWVRGKPRVVKQIELPGSIMDEDFKWATLPVWTALMSNPKNYKDVIDEPWEWEATPEGEEARVVAQP